VKPRMFGHTKHFMDPKKIVIVPKGDPRAHPPSDAGIAAPPVNVDHSKTWSSPVVQLHPQLKSAPGTFCTAAPANIRKTASTTGAVLFTTTAGAQIRVTAPTETVQGGYTWVPVMGRSLSGFVAKTLLGSCNAPAATSSSTFPLFKQCDAGWSGDQLGGCKGTTVCKAGCAMSCVAMILKSKGYDTTPGKLNTWLNANSGFTTNGCAIYWGAVDKLGKTKCQGFQKGTFSTVCGWIKAGYGVVLNVNSGGHWVLGTGCDTSNNVLVNDPGYSKVSYPFSQVGTMVLYK